MRRAPTIRTSRRRSGRSSTEEQKGELDLERFATPESISTDPGVWQLVGEQLELGEMPPAKKPQLAPAQKEQLSAWVRQRLDAIARSNAGDPGPVVVRRLSNAEFAYTLRDLTGIENLDPTEGFPVDGAAGEGFTNTGAALVMSPTLFTKYLDAAKEVAKHVVLLPDGIAFSEKTTPRDWTEEKLAAIRAFYAEFTEIGGGSAVDLQGIRFDTKDGGVLPLDRYFAATLAARAGGAPDLDGIARERGLSPKYLRTLWSALTSTEANALLDPLRARWREAEAGDGSALAEEVARWQRALWQFTTVGHIGKRGGPSAWQEPVSPVVASREVRLALPDDGEDVTLYLAAEAMAGSGANPTVNWRAPRVVAPDHPPVMLHEVGRMAGRAEARMTDELARTAAYLDCLAATLGTGQPVEALAAERGLDPALAARWARVAALGHPVEPRVTGQFSARMDSGAAGGAVVGWGFDATPSVLVNQSDETVVIGTVTLPARGVTMHPSPTRDAAITWRSPIDGAIGVEGLLADTDAHCGNGIDWHVDHVSRDGTTVLARGAFDNGGSEAFEASATVAVRRGDLVVVTVGARDANHGCDTTGVVLAISERGAGGRIWDLGSEIIDRIRDGNPLADSSGIAEVWHLGAAGGDAAEPGAIPPGSILAEWRSRVLRGESGDALAESVQRLLASGDLPGNEQDRILYANLRDWNGVLGWLPPVPSGAGDGAADFEAGAQGVVHAFTIPAAFVHPGAEFVATGTLGSGDGGIRVSASLSPPSESLTGGTILARPGSQAERKLLADLDGFRQLFPAALCYTKIVPVDEVVTLTLFYREDDHFRRLLLDDAQAAALDRLWDELHFVSEDALKLVDVFEQLWQFSTQDGDPTVLEPLREPIAAGAARFRALRDAAGVAQLNDVIAFADRAWRRPLDGREKSDLRDLYRELLADDLSHDAAVRLTLARILAAPDFLYKLEDPPPGKEAAPVSGTELASRLSFFLTSSAPDAELSALAAAGDLRDSVTLAAQARRLLADGRVRRLAIEFGAQWLHVRDFDQHDEKSERYFPEFGPIRAALDEEPVRFFTDFFQNDRSVLDLLAADHVFVNDALAEYYGLPAGGEAWRRVEGVREKGRGGVLGFGAALAMQSGASRTSPILRGNWISETLLGERLPRPPKGVPVLLEEPPAGLTERQLTERHSSDPSCARCHARIDPFGFSLENFDAIGRFRVTDAAGLPIDASTRAADGTAFAGIDGLRDYLLTHRRDDFVRQFCRKLLGYALGRGVILSDEPLLDAMQDDLAANGYRVGRAIEMVVLSPQFREIRGSDHP